MPQRRTVLVLGAGASWEYGLPLGSELVKSIYEIATSSRALAKHLNTAKLPDLLGPGLARNRQRSHRVAIFDSTIDRELQEFSRALLDFGGTSIDQFLRERPEFAPLGKLLIAIALFERERPEEVQKSPGTRHLYLEILDAISPALIAGEDPYLKIISLNYDRSLEFFLCNALRARGGSPTLPDNLITHLHGDLGQLSGNLTYGRPLSVKDEEPHISLIEAADRIKVLGEEAREPYENAARILSAAEVICFLGFQYHREVLQLLFPYNCWGEYRFEGFKIPQIYGTAFGLPKVKLDSATRMLHELTQFHHTFYLDNCKCLDLVDSHPVFDPP